MDAHNVFHSLRDANIERSAHWDPQCLITPSFRGNELAGEVGEACNIVKKLERIRLGLRGSKLEHGPTYIAQLTEELADIMICVDLIAMEWDIDLRQAVIKKFNETSDKVGLNVFLAPTVSGIL